MRTGDGTGQSPYSYSYSAAYIYAGKGDDIVYLTEVSGVDPSGQGLNIRQYVDLGDGADWLTASSFTGMCVLAGAGDDVVIHTDLRTEAGDRETGSYSGHGATAVGPQCDAAWTRLNFVDAGAGDDRVAMGSGDDLVIGGEGDGADIILVSGLALNSIFGMLFSQVKYGPGSNTFFGGAGADTFTIDRIRASEDGGYAAAIDAGEGDDRITITNVASASFVNAGDGNDVINIQAGLATGGRITRHHEPTDSVFAGAGDDIIHTGRGDDLIVGGDGHDWIFAEGGNDHIYVGPVGGAGDGATDHISITQIVDTVFYSGPAFNGDVDVIYDFHPQSRCGAETCKGDVLDLAVALDELGLYDNSSPLSQNEIRAVNNAGANTGLQVFANGGWQTIVRLICVRVDELNLTEQADVSGGLGAKTGGDLLWWTGPVASLIEHQPFAAGSGDVFRAVAAPKPEPVETVLLDPADGDDWWIA